MPLNHQFLPNRTADRRPLEAKDKKSKKNQFDGAHPERLLGADASPLRGRPLGVGTTEN
jgi:hypothetical protein